MKTQELSLVELDQVVGGTDAMSDMSGLMSMRLQMYMDRYSKFFETLSNVLTKVSQTNSSIVQNMR